jgi:hypothetical protein
MTTNVTFSPLPIMVACPIPVTPDGRTLDDHDDPLPLDQRTDRCAVWAHWMVGGTIACDIHCELFCRLGGIDFDELVRDVGRTPADARQPWHQRERATQADALDTVHTLQQLHGQLVAGSEVHIHGYGQL